MSILNSKVAKFAVGLLSVAVFVVGFAAVKVNKASAAVSSADISATTTVRSGDSGSSALTWQMFLNEHGASLVADSKFGPLSAGAAKVWQAGRGLVADGILGALSRAAAIAQLGTLPQQGSCPNGYVAITPVAPLFASCELVSQQQGACPTGYHSVTPVAPLFASCEVDTQVVPVLTGGAGTIEDADFVSGLTNEEVGEGSTDTKVAGLDIDADEGSDLELMSGRLDFTQGTGATNDFEDYAKEVSFWLGSTELARVDGDQFTDDNNYDKTVTFASGAIIKAGGTGQLVVKVSGVGNLDTADIGDEWTVEFENVRYRDASGAIIIDSDTGDIGGVTRTFSFESFATSTDIELKISEANNDAVNTAHMINVNATEKTSNVTLLDFWLEAQGNSNLDIKEFGAEFTVTTAADVDDMISGGTSPAAFLEIAGTKYGTATYQDGAGTTRDILWDDVNYTIPAGQKVRAKIIVDLLAVSGDLNEGDTILALIDEDETDDTTLVDVRDETNTQLVDGDITGTATGEANQVYDVIFTVATSGWTNTPVKVGGFAGEDDEVTFNLEYTVTAVDGDVYIDNTCTEDADGVLVIGDAPDGFDFFQTTGTAASIRLTCSHTTVGATAPTADWLVVNGESEIFKIAITAIADVGTSFVQLGWEGIGWNETDAAGDRLFEGSLDDTYKTNSISLTNR